MTGEGRNISALLHKIANWFLFKTTPRQNQEYISKTKTRQEYFFMNYQNQDKTKNDNTKNLTSQDPKSGLGIPSIT
jgi:hypothetical protein